MKDLTLELLKSCGTKILTNMQMTIIDENTRSSFQLANPGPFANGCKVTLIILLNIIHIKIIYSFK